MKTEEIPLGTTEKPWNEIEQEFEIDILEANGFAYMILGDESCTNQFDVWFRVRTSDYMKAWMKILTRYQ